MFAKNARWMFTLLTLLLIAVFVMGDLTAPVSAARRANDAPNFCLSCHENRYYLHDQGCWYCITAHRDRCAGCHEGNPAATRAEDAHLGMISHPQENNGEKCLECHMAEDAQMRLVKFESMAGFDTVIQPAAYTPVEPVATGFPAVAEPSSFKKLPWMIGGIVLFGFWLALALLSPHKP